MSLFQGTPVQSQASFRSWFLFALVAFTSALTPNAHAQSSDAVLLNGSWIDPASIIEVERGRMSLLLANGAELTRDLSEVEGLRLAQYPQLAQAEQAITEGDDAQAITLLDRVLDQADEDWVQMWTKYQLLSPLDRTNQANRAVTIFLDLAVGNAPPEWLRLPPVASLGRASDAERRRAAQAIQRAIPRVSDELRFEVQVLQDAAGPVGGAENEAPTRAGDTPPAGNGGQANVPRSAENDWTQGGSAIALPAGLVESRDLLLVRQGRMDEALSLLSNDLQSPSSDRSLAERLYLHGRILTSLATESTTEGYRDAALSFMRVAIHYPSHRLMPAALLEASYCHARLGQFTEAQRLYEAFEAAGGLGEDLHGTTGYERRAQEVANLLSASGE